ncbi:4450_t:CDS:2 [Rhizophagus irregularis]|nr:4450_t:CDS:2 [Rhizophagus irregularis]
MAEQTSVKNIRRKVPFPKSSSFMLPIHHFKCVKCDKEFSQK